MTEFGHTALLCQGKIPQFRGMATYLGDGYRAFHQQKVECGCCKMLVLGVCGVRRNLYESRLYHNPDVDNRIFDCLLTSMANMWDEDVCTSFLFMGDLICLIRWGWGL